MAHTPASATMSCRAYPLPPPAVCSLEEAAQSLELGEAGHTSTLVETTRQNTPHMTRTRTSSTSTQTRSDKSSPTPVSAHCSQIPIGCGSLAAESEALAERLSGVLGPVCYAERPKRSLWYSTKFFVTATAAALALVVTLKGLVGGKSTFMYTVGSVTAVASRVSRPDSVVVAHEPSAATDSIVSAVSTLPETVGDAVPARKRATSFARFLGDGEDSATTAPSPRTARIGYLIMTSGVEELHKTKRLLKAIYDPSNFYLVHLDRKNDPAIRRDLEHFIKDWENVRMLVPALDVSWGGYTITLTAIFGVCTMVQWSDEWDFFVNLSASDFPLLPQAELRETLGQYADLGMNFVSGAPLNERNRVEVLIDDQGLYRETQSSKAGRPLKVGKPRLPPSKSMFTVYKGEFWVILHRSFCRYLEASPDNVARSLQAYFSRFRISDESYFQTVLCHPLAPRFPVYSDNLRFVSWPPVSEGHYVLHPEPITGGNVGDAMQSGALFARKFDLEVSQEAYAVLEENLSKSKPDRLARVARRLRPAVAVVGRQRFCAIPKGYSIQEVLSRPPKTAMELHHERTPDASASALSIVGDALAKPIHSPKTRETMSGTANIP